MEYILKSKLFPPHPNDIDITVEHNIAAFAFNPLAVH